MSMGLVWCGRGDQRAQGGEGTWRVLRVACRQGRLCDRHVRLHEGSGGPHAPDDARLSVEGRCSDLHLRFHRWSRADPADHLPPHGQAQGRRTCRIGEARDLDLLPAAQEANARDAQCAWTTDPLADTVTAVRPSLVLSLAVALPLSACRGSPAIAKQPPTPSGQPITSPRASLATPSSPTSAPTVTPARTPLAQSGTAAPAPPTPP